MTEAPVIAPEAIKELFKAGAHFGFSRTRNHPSTKGYIYGYKNRDAVIDLEKMLSSLEVAKQFVTGLGAEGKKILFVGNKEEARQAIRRAAAELDLPYVAGRWMGGTLTNWAQIKSRLDRLAQLKAQREAGELDVYTKKERLLIGKEIERLERYFSGLTGLTALPAALVVVDSREEAIAVKEAQETGIPVVSLSSTDCDVRAIDYPVVGNDTNVLSIDYFLRQLVAAYQAGQAAPRAAAEPAAEARA